MAWLPALNLFIVELVEGCRRLFTFTPTPTRVYLQQGTFSKIFQTKQSLVNL